MLFRRRGTGGYVPPPAVTSRFWVGGTGTWDQATTTHWSATSGGAGGASVPTQYNDVIFDASSGTGTCTCSANAPCNSLTSAASNISLTHNAAVTISIGSNSTTGPSNKALDFSGLVAYSPGGGTSSVLAFVSTVATQQTIHHGGKTIASETFNGAGGSWQYVAAVTGGASSQWSMTAGSLDTNGQTIQFRNFAGSGSSARSLTLGASSITITGAGAGQWDFTTTTGLTFSGASSTITLNGAAGGFRGGGLTYGTVNLTGSGTVVLTGANTYTAFTRSNAAAFATTFPSSVTQTVATAAGLTISGTSGQLHTVTASTAGTAATISIASGTVNANFLSLKDSAATGGATFHAGAGSTNVSGNTGWIFP